MRDLDVLIADLLAFNDLTKDELVELGLRVSAGLEDLSKWYAEEAALIPDGDDPNE